MNIKLKRPNSNSEKYYTTEKENQCVVCASTEQLIRKNVVPREYRKHFPTVMKTHVSHDIVLLCLKVLLRVFSNLNHNFYAVPCTIKRARLLETCRPWRSIQCATGQWKCGACKFGVKGNFLIFFRRKIMLVIRNAKRHDRLEMPWWKTMPSCLRHDGSNWNVCW